MVTPCHCSIAGSPLRRLVMTQTWWPRRASSGATSLRWTPTPVAAGRKSSETMQMERGVAMGASSEIIGSQDLHNPAIRQYSEFAARVADVLLKLERQIEAGPVVAQLNPGKFTVVARINPKKCGQIQVLEAHTFLGDVDQIGLAGCQFLATLRFKQVRHLSGGRCPQGSPVGLIEREAVVLVFGRDRQLAKRGVG